jgi:chorismate synthase
MKNTFGYNVSVTVFGESHGKSVGCVIDGLSPGIKVDEAFIGHMLSLRRPSGSISTQRCEKDEFSIESGVFNGYTTGTPICIIIPNTDTKSADYEKTRFIARPSHADYAANEKYHGFEDYRGGGHFSGRVTAAIVAAGAIALGALNAKGVKIGTHIATLSGINDRDFADYEADIKLLSEKVFPVLDKESEEKMIEKIECARENLDSVGGVLETAVVGIPEGVGEPWFDTAESMISHIMFSIPAVKGIEFGAGFGFADMKGSQANDPLKIENGKIVTEKNDNGGINGGITNGMPIVFRTVIKPTPTIFKPQNTVDFQNMTETVTEPKGRHDPAIVHRARAVQDAATAIVICDMLAMRFGTDWINEL